MDSKGTTILKKTILVIMSLFLLTACYADIEGKVVDAETGEPIEGAVVLVEWTMTKGLPGLSYTESSKVIEVVSDKEGKVHIEGYFKPFANKPSVTVYKRGYVAWNNRMIFPSYVKRNDFSWSNGYVFKLEQWKEGFSHAEHAGFMIDLGLSQLTNSSFRNEYFIESQLGREMKEKKGR